MIRYVLKCGAGHEFEAWFASSAAFESQEQDGSLACPACARTDISRAIMAPSVTTRRDAPQNAPAQQSAPPDPAATRASQTSAPALHANAPNAQHLQEMMREVRAMRDRILAQSEYVGARFAEEARRIHFEEAPDRAIHGEASAEEVRELTEEGIDVMPVPRLPDDLN